MTRCLLGCSVCLFVCEGLCSDGEDDMLSLVID